jgi:hypothetical protein
VAGRHIACEADARQNRASGQSVTRLLCLPTCQSLIWNRLFAICAQQNMRTFSRHDTEGMTMSNTAFLSVRLPESVWNRVKAVAAQRGEPVQELIGGLIERFLEEAEPPPWKRKCARSAAC